MRLSFAGRVRDGAGSLQRSSDKDRTRQQHVTRATGFFYHRSEEQPPPPAQAPGFVLV